MNNNEKTRSAKIPNLQKALMKRDGITANQANTAINQMKEEMYDRLTDGETTTDICEEYYCLELEDLI